MGVAAEEIRRIRSKQVMKQSGVPKKYIFWTLLYLKM
jgi:hypothetical protein